MFALYKISFKEKRQALDLLLSKLSGPQLEDFKAAQELTGRVCVSAECSEILGFPKRSPCARVGGDHCVINQVASYLESEHLEIGALWAFQHRYNIVRDRKWVLATFVRNILESRDITGFRTILNLVKK